MSDEQDHMDYEVNNHVEVSVTPFPCKGRLPKKKIRKKCGLLPNQGWGEGPGISEGKQKTNPQVWALKNGQKWLKNDQKT